MRMRLVAMIGILTLVVGTACAAATTGPNPAAVGEPAARSADTARPKADEAARPGSAAQSAGAPARAASAPQSAGGPPADAAQQTLPGLDRMIIRTVTMTISVLNVQEAYQQVERIALEQRGLVAGSQIRQDGDRTTATVTVRVPADSATYQATLERLRAIAEKVIEEQSQAQDITEEFVDLESRLRNLQATEDTLRALLARAQRIEDILPIQRELTNVRGQIEQIQGRKQALERRADLATITLQIREHAAVGRGTWSPGDTIGEAVLALGRALGGLLTVAIWLLVWTPVWGAALLLIWVLRRLGRLRVRPRPAA